MPRQLPLHVATDLSLVLFVGMLILWARGHRACDSVFAGYFNYQPSRASGFEDAQMVVAVHERGRWDVAVVRRNCVGSLGGSRKAGPGTSGEWLTVSSHAGRELDAARQWTLTSPDGTMFGSRYVATRTILGFRYATNPFSKSLRVPDWSLAILAGLLPAFRVASAGRRRRRLKRLDRCVACGYDLRATPDKCPECGQAPANR